MTDAFDKHSPGLDSPGSRGFAVTPNDSTDLAISARALYIGGNGDLKVDTTGGDTLTFVSISGILPMRVKRVYSTGTTATSIVGLY